MKKTLLLMLFPILLGISGQASNFQSLKNIAEVGFIVELGFITAKWAAKHDLIKLPSFKMPIALQEDKQV